uniref:Galactose-1-phosphate uridylyltransferase n=1 Tax=Caldisericum exile TaxID=693075 RepID=A0A7C4XTR2_9BACT
MPELRRDPTTGKWVIIATERALRPTDFKSEEDVTKGPIDCPFCAGHESMTPPEITAIREEGSEENKGGWLVRVVPNKFPALKVEGELNRHGRGIYDVMNGIGAHEIIIESKDHYHSLESLPLQQVEKVIWMFRERMLDLRKDIRLKYILIFKNRGRRAGASLEHPHSQLIATPVLPDVVKLELDMALKYYQYKERCIYCDIVEQELETKERLIDENEKFVSFVPFAAAMPFEIIILPKEHISDFGQLKANEISRLASILQNSLMMLEKAVPSVPYNFYIHTSPLDNLSIPYYHFHIHIVPRLTQLAGFEWGSGFYINPMIPEEAANYLRKVKGV